MRWWGIAGVMAVWVLVASCESTDSPITLDDTGDIAADRNSFPVDTLEVRSVDRHEIRFVSPDLEVWEFFGDALELLVPDLKPDCDQAPYPFGCPCAEHDDCNTGFCIETANGKACTQVCVDDCPEGWACSQVVGFGSDVLFLCVDPFVQLCRPCKDSDVCEGGQCVPYGEDGSSFCGAACADDAGCPGGYSCQEVDAGTNQCVKENDICLCTGKFVDEGAETFCSVTNEFGLCGGAAKCLETGESPDCDAAIPVEEACDGADNDCDGLIDEVPPACDTGMYCECDAGECGCACPEGTDWCDEICVDLLNNTQHCGQCNKACVGPNVKVAACDNGECKATTCENGWADGDDKFENGCECQVANEVCDGVDNDCNGQVDEGGNLCGGTGDCTGQCQEGLCVCPEGCQACDGVCKPEIFFQTSPDNCGQCGFVCNLPATVVHGCEDGKCTPVECANGQKDCNLLPGDGCEFELGIEACDGLDNDCDGEADEALEVVCPQGMICENAECVCPQGLSPCDGKCVDLMASPEHCGECGSPCNVDTFPGVMSAKCMGGWCEPGPCKAGWFDTDLLSPGCECFKTAVVEKCDDIDNNCNGLTDEAPTTDCKDPKVCIAGVCHCDPNQPALLDCGGFCVDALTSVQYCGDCNTNCNQMGWPNVDTYDCNGGMCEIKSCDGNFKDVNGKEDDGCECFFTSVVEQCDGVDNNCDGKIDEDPTGEGQVCNTGMGEPCAFGKMQCLDGALECLPDIPPGTFIETCNGLDDDCDGVVDEEIPDAGLPCDVVGTLGPCVDGALECIDGDMECVSLFEETPELCDGVDSDCNGVVDDKPGDAGLDCETGLPGVCFDGLTECNGGETECIPIIKPDEQPEECNGKDDDCDGEIDQGNPGGLLQCEVPGKLGECAKGATQCVAGQIKCESDIAPTDEICDGLDNDCNGQADETIAGAGEPCVVDGAMGVCAAGKMLCSENGLFCASDEEASPEVCDGLDNNCNGTPDDGNPEGGTPCQVDGAQGPCKQGQTACVNGALPCQQTEFGTDEACDGIDNNCDGQVDNNPQDIGGPCQVPGANGICANGQTACNAGNKQCEQTVLPQGETCDNLDNNCNGVVDDDGAQGCQTYFYDGDSDGYASNNAGSKCLCSPSGGYTATMKGDCNDNSSAAYPGAPEKCDWIDNNCNNQVDEENAQGCSSYYQDGDNDGYGGNSSKCLCGPDGNYTTKNSGDCDDWDFSVKPGATEKCDGKDNDCDNKTDEDGAQGCTTYYCDNDNDGYGDKYKSSKCMCNSSGCYDVTKSGDCNDSSSSIKPGATEKCNNVDDDCDGAKDENASCPSGQECLNGSCQSLCVDVQVDASQAKLYSGGSQASGIQPNCSTNWWLGGWHNGTFVNNVNVRWTWTATCGIPSASNPLNYAGENARWSITAKADGYYDILAKVPAEAYVCSVNNKPGSYRYASDVYYGLDRYGESGKISGAWNTANYKNQWMKVFSNVHLKKGTSKLILYDHGSTATGGCNSPSSGSSRFILVDTVKAVCK